MTCPDGGQALAEHTIASLPEGASCSNPDKGYYKLASGDSWRGRVAGRSLRFWGRFVPQLREKYT